jgi:hypothetical protein
VCINFCGGWADRQTVGGDVNILYSINIDLTLEQANFILTNENVSIKI